jgi:apolipoprotein N-acyltransferase
VQTNNATFADSGQSMQQLNISRIRAVENNKWVVSISTTGVSAIIDNEGSVRQITKQNESSFVSGAIVLSSNDSLSNNLGNWSALISVLAALFIYFRKRKNNA